MGQSRRWAPLLCLFVSGLFLVFLPAARGQNSDADFDSVFEEYLSGYWKASPAGAATPAGVHTYDAQVEDFAGAAIQAEIQRNRGFLQRFRRMEAASLPVGRRVDLAIALDHIQLTLLELEEIQSWKRNPRFYVALLRDAVLALIKREFAPAERRFQSVLSRLKLFPRALQQARANLQNPPELYTRKAVELVPRAADFLEKDVPQAAAEQGVGKRLQRQVAREAARAGAALRQFGVWLANDLLPRSKGSFVLGPEQYHRRFRHYQGTATAPEEVLAAAERDLRSTREQMRTLASRITPGGSVRQVLEQLAHERPNPGNVGNFLASFRDSAAQVHRFVEEKRLAPLPQPDRLRILPAPPFLATTGAFVDPPGPFESDLPSPYYVAPPDRFSLGAEAIPLLTVREVYPGRYVQWEMMNRGQRLARKVFASPAFIEGWAHYCEQMMLEEGFAPNLKARLFELRSALRSQIDAILDIRLHTGRSSPADALKLLMDEGFDEEAGAQETVDRLAFAPAQLSSAYSGKLEILRLREEMKQKRGPAFSLGEFHEALLALGAPPLRHARILLFGE